MTLGSGQRVLIVDDSPIMRQILYKIFSSHGFNVVAEAADGIEAIEKYKEFRPDLTTLDIVMPKMMGVEALEKIMADYPEAKVIMASSISDARTVMRCLKAGASQYIVKPYDEEKILAVVGKVLKL